MIRSSQSLDAHEGPRLSRMPAPKSLGEATDSPAFWRAILSGRAAARSLTSVSRRLHNGLLIGFVIPAAGRAAQTESAPARPLQVVGIHRSSCRKNEWRPGRVATVRHERATNRRYESRWIRIVTTQPFGHRRTNSMHVFNLQRRSSRETSLPASLSLRADTRRLGGASGAVPSQQHDSQTSGTPVP